VEVVLQEHVERTQPARSVFTVLSRHCTYSALHTRRVKVSWAMRFTKVLREGPNNTAGMVSTPDTHTLP
jgi:hypothetical protein